MTPHPRRRSGHRGFTFVELMMTLAILAVLATATAPLAQIAAQRQKERELRAALMQIREAIDAYKRASEQGRIRLQLGDSGYPPSLEDLVIGVVDQRSPVAQRLYFLRRLPVDPFASPESWGAQGGWGLRSYASRPETPEPGSDVFDVFSTSDKVGLNAVPYRLW